MLKPIPVEEACRHRSHSPKKQKSKKDIETLTDTAVSRDDHFLKAMCASLLNFLNKGAKSTIVQIDEIIIGLQRSVLKLQKKKHELLHQEHEKIKNEERVNFKKKRIG